MSARMIGVCEHGDHPAPDGIRFCSAACAKCELADFDESTATCARICLRPAERTKSDPRTKPRGTR